MKKSEIKIIAIILCAALVMGAAFGIAAFCVYATYEKELAACRALSDGGITPEKLKNVLSAAKNFKDERTYGNLFVLADKISDCDKSGLSNAVCAYRNPVKKPQGSIFLGLRYYVGIKDSLDFFKGGAVGDFPNLSDGQWGNLISAAHDVAAGICLQGEDKLAQAWEDRNDVKSNKNDLSKAPYKSIYNLFTYLIDITRNVDIDRLDFLDAFLGDGFNENAVKGCKSFISALRSLNFSKFSDIVTYLPDRAAFITACAVNFCDDNTAEFTSSVKYIIEEVFQKDIGFAEKEWADKLNYLRSLNPDEMNAEQRRRAEDIAEDFIKTVEDLRRTVEQDEP